MSKLENFLNYKAKIIHLKSLDISKQSSTILSNELFRGNSIIISDCRICLTRVFKKYYVGIFRFSNKTEKKKLKISFFGNRNIWCIYGVGMRREGNRAGYGILIFTVTS